jgi:hypothetical protein
MLQSMYKELGQLQLRRATGGGTSTVIDTTILGRYTDETPVNGTMFIVRDSAGAGAAPEGEFNRISNYVDSTTTFTVDTAFTTAVASGDIYGWANSRYPLDLMIQMANDGLRALGDMPLVDTTTLDTAAAQTEYTYAVAWKRTPPYRVDIQGTVGDANDNDWLETRNWEYVPAAAGSTGLVVFHSQPPTGRDIRIWYRGPHGTLNAYSDVVNEAINPELAVVMGALKALEFANSRVQGSDPFILQRINKLEARRIELTSDRPIHRPTRKAKILVVGTGQGDHLPYPPPYGPS